MTAKNVLALAFEAGIRPFDPVPSASASSRAVSDLAATLLGDSNLYFRKDYRDKFSVKVHTIELSPYRLVMACVESAQPPNADRRYRTVIFRCDGEVLYQTPDSRVLDVHAANVELRYEMSSINEDKILIQLCQQQVRDATRMRDNAERAINALAKQGHP
jgi:hypothetical protein